MIHSPFSSLMRYLGAVKGLGFRVKIGHEFLAPRILGLSVWSGKTGHECAAEVLLTGPQRRSVEVLEGRSVAGENSFSRVEGAL